VGSKADERFYPAWQGLFASASHLQRLVFRGLLAIFDNLSRCVLQRNQAFMWVRLFAADEAASSLAASIAATQSAAASAVAASTTAAAASAASAVAASTAAASAMAAFNAATKSAAASAAATSAVYPIWFLSVFELKQANRYHG